MLSIRIECFDPLKPLADKKANQPSKRAAVRLRLIDTRANGGAFDIAERGFAEPPTATIFISFSRPFRDNPSTWAISPFAPNPIVTGLTIYGGLL